MTKASSSEGFFDKFPKESLFRILMNQVDYSICYLSADERGIYG